MMEPRLWSRLPNSTILLISITPGRVNEVTKYILRILARENFRLGRPSSRGHFLKCLGHYSLLIAIDSIPPHPIISHLGHVPGIRKVSAHCGTAIHHTPFDGFRYQQGLPLLPFGAFLFLKIDNLLMLRLRTRTISLLHDCINWAIRSQIPEADLLLDDLPNIPKVSSSQCISYDLLALDGANEILCVVRTNGFGVLHKAAEVICHGMSLVDYDRSFHGGSGGEQESPPSLWRQCREMISDVLQSGFNSLVVMSTSFAGYSLDFMYNARRFEEEAFAYLYKNGTGAFDGSAETRGPDLHYQMSTPEGSKLVRDKLAFSSGASSESYDINLYARVVTGKRKQAVDLITKHHKVLRDGYLICRHHLEFKTSGQRPEDYILEQIALHQAMKIGDDPFYSLNTRIRSRTDPEEHYSFETKRHSLVGRLTPITVALEDSQDKRTHISDEDKEFLKILRKVEFLSKDTYDLLFALISKYKRCMGNGVMYTYLLPARRFVQNVIRTTYTTLAQAPNRRGEEVFASPVVDILIKDLRNSWHDPDPDREFCSYANQRFQEWKNYIQECATIFEAVHSQFVANSYSIGSDVDDSTFAFVIGYHRTLLGIWGLHNYLYTRGTFSRTSETLCLVHARDRIEYSRAHSVVYISTRLTQDFYRGFLVAHEVGHEILFSGKHSIHKWLVCCILAAMSEGLVGLLGVDILVKINDLTFNKRVVLDSEESYSGFQEALEQLKTALSQLVQLFGGFPFRAESALPTIDSAAIETVLNYAAAVTYFDGLTRSDIFLEKLSPDDKQIADAYEFLTAQIPSCEQSIPVTLTEDVFCDLYCYEIFFKENIDYCASKTDCSPRPPREAADDLPMRWFLLSSFDHIKGPQDSNHDIVCYQAIRCYMVYLYHKCIASAESRSTREKLGSAGFAPPDWEERTRRLHGLKNRISSEIDSFFDYIEKLRSEDNLAKELLGVITRDGFQMGLRQLAGEYMFTPLMLYLALNSFVSLMRSTAAERAATSGGGHPVRDSMARAIYLSMLEWHFDRSSFWGLLSTHQDSQIQVSEGDREILRDQFFSNARRKIMLRRYSPRTFEDVTKSQDFTSLGLDAPPRNAEECLRDWEREDGQLSRDVADLVREHGSPQRHRARFVRRAYLSHAYKILCEEFGNKLFP